MDLLSTLLREVGVTASALGTLHLRSPFHLWLRYPMPHSFTVLSGQCTWTDAVHQQPQVLHEGDSVLVLQTLNSAMASDPALPAVSMETAWRANGLPSFHGEADFSQPLQLNWGGDGAPCELLGVSFSFEARQRPPLLSLLPPSLIVRRSPLGADAGIGAAIAFLTAEHERALPGYAAMATHLARTVFAGLLRSHALHGQPPTRGLLAGLRDARLALALQAVHAHPAERWTVARMAQAAALSRSVFAKRFSTAVGITPMDYVALLRLHDAGHRLVDEPVSISALAQETGYASERAFRAAFLRQFGQSPSAWRKARRADR